MKTIVGFALLLCVATAVGKPAKPQDLQNCLQEAWREFAVKNLPCSIKILDIFQSQKVNDSYIASVCGSACRKEANDYFKEKCGVSLGEIFCSKDPRDQHYCFTYNKRLHTLGQFSEAVQGPCASKDCSDPTCNAAVKNISCCAKEENEFSTDIGGHVYKLPGNCMFQGECTN